MILSGLSSVRVNLFSIVLCLFILPISAFSQHDEFTSESKKAIKYFEEARKDFYQNELMDCLENVEKALSYDQNFIEAWMLRGESYEALKSSDAALQSYYTAFRIDSMYLPHLRLAIGELEFNRANYDIAYDFFSSFLPYSSSQRRNAYIDKKLKQIDFIRDAMNNPVDFQPINLGDSINSEYDDYIEILSTDETDLYLTRKQPVAPGENKRMEEDLYLSFLSDSTWEKAQRFKLPIDMRGNEGAVSVSPDGIYLFFSACNRHDGMGSCDIYISIKNGGEWSDAANMGPNINSRSWDSQPCFSADGKTLFFSSRRGGGKGKADIWYSVLDDTGRFGVPVNLGDSVNTSGDEFTPFIHPDGKTLYFSSDGHLGMGKTDLFVCRKKDDGSWSSPVNLGYPVNTVESEIKLIVTPKGDKAYISTNREDGRGAYDIYSFLLDEKMRPEPVSYVKGIVFDEETEIPLGATLELTDLKTQKIVVTSFADQQDGSFMLCLPAGKDYALNVSHKGYLFYSKNFSSAINTLEPILMDIPMKPIKTGNIIVLNNIFYDHNSAELKPASFAELQAVVELMIKNPELKLEIGGHTDDTGSDDYNKKLSKERAFSVKNYLVGSGIIAERIEAVGYGELVPVASNDNEEGRAMNRRTEIKVL